MRAMVHSPPGCDLATYEHVERHVNGFHRSPSTSGIEEIRTDSDRWVPVRNAQFVLRIRRSGVRITLGALDSSSTYRRRSLDFHLAAGLIVRVLSVFAI